MLDWAMAHPAFKTQLFRFVDVFPALDGRRRRRPPPRRVLRRRRGPAAARPRRRRGRPRAVRQGARGARSPAATSCAWPSSSSSARPPTEAVEGLHRLWRAGSAATVDLLGEKTVVGGRGRPVRGPGRRAARRARRRASALGARRPPRARRPRPDPARQREHQADRAGDALRAAHPRATASSRRKARIRPLLRLARERGAFVHFDMEHYDVKDLTLAAVPRPARASPSSPTLDAGIVIQAYLKDSRDDLADLIAWSSATRQRRSPCAW